MLNMLKFQKVQLGLLRIGSRSKFGIADIRRKSMDLAQEKMPE